MNDALAHLMTERRGRTIGHTIIFTDSTSSTQDELSALSERGAGSGTVVVARRQSSGRGRRGRTFLSFEGSLTFSVLFRPVDLPPSQISFLSMRVAAAMLHACESFPAVAPCEIKWPNDLVRRRPDGIQGQGMYRKIAGILSEASFVGDRASVVVIGIGVNVIEPGRGYGPVADIAESFFDDRMIADHEAESIERQLLVLNAILDGLEFWLPMSARSPSTSAVVSRIQPALAYRGEWMRSDPDGEHPSGVVGRLRGLSATGGLLLEDDAGRVVEIVSGEVSVRPRDEHSVARADADRNGSVVGL